MNHAVVRGTLSGGAYFARRYRIVRALAAGGMGAVYEVFDEATRSPRALKVMLPSVVESPEHRMRFEREAQLTGALESEHLVRITDAGIDGDVPFIVMELLRGEDLRSVLRKRGRLPPELVVPYLRQVALALEKTHAAGIIHRDLKPANLFLAQRDDGTPCMKVLDFGIAKLTTASSAIETGTVGTPLYMAPEQARGDRGVTHLADLLALAHVAYALLVGEAYFQEELERSDSIVGVFMAVADGAREAPCARAWRRKSVRLPPGFDAWFLQAAAAHPEARFQNARAQIEALASALAGSSAAAQVKTAAMLASAFEPPRGAQPAQAYAPPPAQAHPHPHAAHASASHGGAWSQASGQAQRAPQAPVASKAKPPPAWLWGAVALALGALFALVVFVGSAQLEAARSASASEQEASDDDARERDDEEPDGKSAKASSAKASSKRSEPPDRSPKPPGGGLCNFAACRPVTMAASRRADPVDWLDDAQALARSFAPDARMFLLKIDRARAGAAEVSPEVGGVSYVFDAGGEHLMISVYRDQLTVMKPKGDVIKDQKRPPRPGPKPCSVARVGAELRKLGVPDEETVMLLYQALEGVPVVWRAERASGEQIVLDGATCAPVK